ncbi:uncharacterized protein VTP21DRAFT_1133 [Calcarisporiella thermophila]|uniref:uncharacterized protein n=1 Tax=Calcarisporiella thermophila TaxID=911321 RepID=UPI003744140B
MDNIPSPAPAGVEAAPEQSITPQNFTTLLPPEILSRMSPEEIARFEREQKFLKEHAGHETAHSLMILILLFTLIAFQFIIIFWKRKHPSSYQIISLGGLWIIPLVIGFIAKWWRFLVIWSVFSVANSWVLRRAMQIPQHHTTPRIVYKFYFWVYSISFAVGACGYLIVMLTLFNVTPLFVSGDSAIDIGIVLLCNGLYFGVLGRDIVEIISVRMASNLGYYSKEGFPRKHLRGNTCAICGAPAGPAGSTPITQEEPALQELQHEPVHQLNCKHMFHELCIRGWCIIGKKDMCPYCKEKVDLREFRTNPWDTQQQLYLSLLDGIRYLVVWNPIIFVVLQAAFYVMGLK